MLAPITVIARCPPKIINALCSAFSVSIDRTGTCPRILNACVTGDLQPYSKTSENYEEEKNENLLFFFSIKRFRIQRTKKNILCCRPRLECFNKQPCRISIRSVCTNLSKPLMSRCSSQSKMKFSDSSNCSFIFSVVLDNITSVPWQSVRSI